MSAWTGEQWQYDILVVAHRDAFRLLRDLWIVQVLGRWPAGNVLLAGHELPRARKDYFAEPLEAGMRELADYAWGRVLMAEKLARSTSYPPLDRLTLLRVPE